MFFFSHKTKNFAHLFNQNSYMIYYKIYFQYIRYNWAEMLKKRKGNQRRLIHALPVNLELDLFEARIATLYDVVDVFLIGGM